VAGDVREDATRAALIEVCPAPDILVTNNAGPEPAGYRDWDRAAWLSALEANLLAPALMVRDVLDGMVERRFGRIVNITSAMVKAPIGAMGLSSGARAGLTAAMKGVSRDVARANVTINNLCPERFDTARQAQMADLASRVKGITVEEAYDEMRGTIAARRLGDPGELGDTCAFLCSAQAGYLSGQSISLDGGTHPGLF
jgi:3-oxoacyl-[acyl-carrier protein] reductase